MSTTAASPSLGLESSETIFRAFVAHTPLGIFVSDASGACTYVNERWCELAGLSRAQALGDGWAAAIHPDDVKRVLAEWAEASRTERESIVEYRFLRPDGGISIIQGFASALHDDDGNVTGWVGSCLDLTTSRQAEDAVGDLGRRFEAAFDHAPIGIALTAPDGRFLDANDALCTITGYSKAELLGLTVGEITHPDDRAASHENLLRHEADGKDTHIEKRYLHADGTTVWVSASRTLVQSADGRPLYTVAHIENITSRREAQRSLEEAEERFRRAFDDAPIGMALVGVDGSFLRTNVSLCRMLGYAEPELRELQLEDITHPDDLETSSEWVRDLLAGELGASTNEKRLVCKNGTVMWAMLSISLVRDATDNPLYFITQIQDVHLRKLAEAENARLLARERDQIERLRALDVLKDEFVASVSHELRTPLTSIKGYLELVLGGDAGPLTEEQRSHLTTVDRNSEKLLRLVGDLLFVGQADAGKLEFDIGDVDLATLASESVESARPSAVAKQIRLELRVDEIPSFRGDRARLSQLIDNLVSNALKFTQEGGTVTVSLTRDDDLAVLAVRDTGIGIPAAEQEKLFDRFFRARGAADRAIQGTGLGLSIAKTIAEGHGGRIGLESVDGIGTTFHVELPLGVMQRAI